MLSPNAVYLLSLLGMLTISAGILCCVYIALDQPHRQAPDMPVMKWVWPINALWAGPLAILAYRAWGNGRSLFVRTGGVNNGCPAPSPAKGEEKSGMLMPHEAAMPDTERHAETVRHEEKDDPEFRGMAMPMESTDMSSMGMDMNAMTSMNSGRSFPAKVAVGTLHCGAGCTLADLVGPWLFLLVSFTVLGSRVFGEWALEYVLALLFGVVFQYAGLASMAKKRGVALWWRAFRVDFLSLTAWQVGMYAWMALCSFVLIGPMSPEEPLFWFMMQIAMACGYITAYPMNWLLIRSGIKTAM